MEKVTIEVRAREKVGKEDAKKVRQQGLVPAVVYGKDTNLSVVLSSQEMKALRKIHFSESTIIEMGVEGDKKSEKLSVLIKSVQYNPMTEAVIHLDFLKVSLTEKIKVHVPIILKGEPKGVVDGGVVDQVHREVEVEVLPLDMPEHIDLDIAALEIGQSLHVLDLQIPENVVVITSPTEVLVTLVAKKEEVEEETAVEGEAPTEPEVIKEKKPGEGEEAKS